MLKYILLGTSMCIASPALAQEIPAPDTQTMDQLPVSEPAAPAQDAPQPAEATPATPATPAPATAAAQPAPTAQPASQRIAGIVSSEFASYDKNGDGALDQSEFGTWMVALRLKAEPAFAADSPEGKAWVSAAFAQADADKSASVNAAELTAFLTPKSAA